MAKLILEYLDIIPVKGKKYYYYRRGGRRIKLPNDIYSLEFNEAYRRTHASFEDKKVTTNLVGTINNLIISYKSSSDFKELKPRVKELYLPILDAFQEKYGNLSKDGITRRFLMEWRDSMSSTPGKANNSMTTMRSVMRFARDRGIIKVNPTDKIKKLKMGSWRCWTQSEIDSFLEICPENMRLAIFLGIYTGQRINDITKMRWNQIVDGGINVVQEKTGQELWIPIHTDLAKQIEKTKKTSVMILTTQSGKPFLRRNLSEKFKETCREAGLPEDCVFHGLRKTAAVRLAEAGCTSNQIRAITGHLTTDMVEYYTRGADQKKIAQDAMNKLIKFSTTKITD